MNRDLNTQASVNQLKATVEPLNLAKIDASRSVPYFFADGKQS